jgi:hypothetical protein
MGPRELFKLGSLNSIKHLIFIIFNYQLHFRPWQGRDDRRAAIPLVLKKHASFRRVAGLWIATKNTGDLRKIFCVRYQKIFYFVLITRRNQKFREDEIKFGASQIAAIAVSSFPSTIN